MSAVERFRPDPDNEIRNMDSSELKRHGVVLVLGGLLVGAVTFMGLLDPFPGLTAYLPSAAILVMSLPAWIELLARRAER